MHITNGTKESIWPYGPNPLRNDIARMMWVTFPTNIEWNVSTLLLWPLACPSNSVFHFILAAYILSGSSLARRRSDLRGDRQFCRSSPRFFSWYRTFTYIHLCKEAGAHNCTTSWAIPTRTVQRVSTYVQARRTQSTAELNVHQSTSFRGTSASFATAIAALEYPEKTASTNSQMEAEWIENANCTLPELPRLILHSAAAHS